MTHGHGPRHGHARRRAPRGSVATFHNAQVAASSRNAGSRANLLVSAARVPSRGTHTRGCGGLCTSKYGQSASGALLAGPPATVLQRPSCVRQRPAATSHHPAIWGHACHATWHVGALPTTGGAFGALLHANTYVLKLDVAGAAPTGTSEAPARSEGKMGRAGARARRSRRAASVSRARRLLLLDPLRRRVDR